MGSSSPRLFLIDTFGLIFRAFYGRARAPVPSMRSSAGIPTEAVYIFTTMLRRLLADYKPEYVAAVWEGEGPSFRDELFEQYKSNREAMPSELAQQLPYIQRLLEAWHVPVIAEDRYEADDTIAALARQAAAQGLEVWIVSSDKDLTQLVGGRVSMLNPMKDNLLYDIEKVKELMGVPPEHVVDLLALKGDSIDNIPGAPGIGEKGARTLIAEYGCVENVIEHAAEIKRKTYRESLQQNREQILLSKKLATLAADVPVRLDLDAVRAAEPDLRVLRELYQELEFHSLLGELELLDENTDTASHTFESADAFKRWLAEAIGANPAEAPVMSLAVELAGPEEWSRGGVAFCARPGKAWLLPAKLLAAAKEFLEDPAWRKRVHDAKAAFAMLSGKDITLAGVVDDTMLAAFLVDSSRVDYSLPKTVARRFGERFDPTSAVSLTRAADLIRRLGEVLEPEIEKQGLQDVYTNIELPLAAVLARMESAGVLLDREALASLSIELEARIDGLVREIHDLAGSTFNVNSPKQLATVLFEDLKLPAPPRRGKTKSRSTASDVLEKLAAEHPIAAKILEHRQLTKLKGTYIDALPALVSGTTARLHTTFNQTGSGTGRLSSSNPNLQNIPIRTELGRQIRAAFVSPPGSTLLSADYSQIELRILAHMSGDAVLSDAFRKGEDIHTRTAAEVFGIPPLLVGAEERRRAKAINFGIVYGLSPFGLSQQLGIPVGDARAYIEAYFELYAGVKAFIEGAIEQARQSGFSRTMLGRQRPITDLDSRNPAARGFAERIAINSPIQGSAADLIKLAMIRVDQRIRDEERRTTMLLQVHDELLFEVAEEETAAVAQMVKKEMEGVYELAVPLVADVKAGKNWRDMTAV